MLRTLLQLIAAVGFAFLLIEVLVISVASTPTLVYEREATSTAVQRATTSMETTPVTTIASSTPKKSPIKKAATKPSIPAPSTPVATTSDNEVHRIENPYNVGPLDPDILNRNTRTALVNIFCETQGSQQLSSISGSGVIIDPRGVILTNAHVAQYVLLSTAPEIDLRCAVRTGSPASPQWTASILYIPQAWVQAHAADIVKQKPTGTGEYDYALLMINDSLNGTPLPPVFSFVPADTREAIGFTSDSVLVAAYPAEFAGASTRSFLYPSTVWTRIGDLLTFNESTVDLMSLGSTALAQSGSSGGAVVNLWGQLVGLVTTTSGGATTAERDLHALTLSYINHDIQHKTGEGLRAFISANPVAKASDFTQNEAPALAKQIVHYLEAQ